MIRLSVWFAVTAFPIFTSSMRYLLANFKTFIWSDVPVFSLKPHIWELKRNPLGLPETLWSQDGPSLVCTLKSLPLLLCLCGPPTSKPANTLVSPQGGLALLPTFVEFFLLPISQLDPALKNHKLYKMWGLWCHTSPSSLVAYPVARLPGSTR